MWKYNYTDELYHSYKYISREWKNGRWVYNYNQSKLNEAKKRSRSNSFKMFRSAALSVNSANERDAKKYIKEGRKYQNLRDKANNDVTKETVKKALGTALTKGLNNISKAKKKVAKSISKLTGKSPSVPIGESYKKGKYTYTRISKYAYAKTDNIKKKKK